MGGPPAMSKVFVTRRLPASVLSRLEAAAAVDVYAGDGEIPSAELRTRVSDADALVSMVTDPINRDAVAAHATAFGMHVACASPRSGNPGDAEPMSLDRLLNTSDVVSLHVPLTAETHHLIDQRALARMKRSAYLVNTTRGPVVDESA